MTTETETTPRQKIEAAMAALGLTVTAVFVPWSASRNAKEKHRSLNWRVTVQRNGRDVLTTDYSAGVGHCPSYKATKGALARAHYVEETARYMAIKHETETGRSAVWSFGELSKSGGKPIEIDAVSVVSSLTLDSSVLDAGGFEEWAGDFGYDTDSRAAEATYRACLDIALKLRGAIGDAGMEALRVAGEDF